MGTMGAKISLGFVIKYLELASEHMLLDVSAFGDVYTVLGFIGDMKIE